LLICRICAAGILDRAALPIDLIELWDYSADDNVARAGCFH
jgi:hypothetical protein